MQIDRALQKKLIEFINRSDYKPAKPKSIARQMGLNDADQLKELKRVIKQLVKTGQVVYGPKHIVLKGTAASKSNEIVGRFTRAASGYGFVAHDGQHVDTAEDIFIAERHSLDAANGDLVRVRVSARKREARHRVSGRILEVVERRTHQFVGTYHERGGLGLVKVDGNVFENEVLVGDAGAKNCRVGHKVVIEMVRFPRATRHGEAVIVSVLGDIGKPGVDTQTIIHQFDLPGDFPESALNDARKQAEDFDESIAGNRVDFTDETVITIDPKEARDFDDAISLKKIENGHWQLGVHIADVSHFVLPNSDLDNEAYRRATSVYLPDLVIPMLPEIISNNLASLQPNRVRYTMTALIEFTDDGVPVSTELHRGAIRSQHRFNYEEIDGYLEDDQPWKNKLSPDLFRLVRDMHTLAMKLRSRRMDAGAFDLIVPEIKIDLDDQGRVCGAHTRKNTESHQIIEEFMLAANIAVARFLVDEKLHLMRRIHDAPSATKLAELKTLMRELGFPSTNIQSRFEMKRIIEESRDRPERDAVHYAILRAMQKAVYGPREIGHYALATESYCHFTSPIRRYPDLIIHRMVGALIDGHQPASEFQMLQRLGDHCSQLEQRAEQAERELIKLKLINYLRERIGMEMDAVISGVEPYGLFAQGKQLPATGLIPLECLPHDQYYFDRGSRTLEGHRSGNTFRLGDPVRVRVTLADPDRREIEFELVGKKQKSKKENQARKQDGRKPRKHR